MYVEVGVWGLDSRGCYEPQVEYGIVETDFILSLGFPYFSSSVIHLSIGDCSLFVNIEDDSFEAFWAQFFDV